MTDPDVVVRPLDQPGDLGWVVMAHGEQYAREFGWNTDFEALVARIVADYATHDPARQPAGDPAREAAWIAEVDGHRVGCVFCVAADPDIAQLRLLLVTDAGRGHGLGARLVDTCLAFARTAGYPRMRLWTNHPLAAARHIYLSRGFTLTAEDSHHSFGAALTGQTYDLDLDLTPANPR